MAFLLTLVGPTTVMLYDRDGKDHNRCRVPGWQSSLEGWINNQEVGYWSAPESSGFATAHLGLSTMHGFPHTKAFKGVRKDFNATVRKYVRSGARGRLTLQLAFSPSEWNKQAESEKN